MRFLCYTLGDDSKGFPPPSPEMMAEMGKFIEEAQDAGVLVVTGGLAPSATTTKVAYNGGNIAVTDGPFAEAKEIIGGFAILDVETKDEAIAWIKRFIAIVGEGDSNIREIFGPD